MDNQLDNQLIPLIAINVHVMLLALILIIRKKRKVYHKKWANRRCTFSNFSLNNTINLEESTTDEQKKDEESMVFDFNEFTEAENTSEGDTNKTAFGDKTNDSSLSEANTFSNSSEQSLCCSTIKDGSRSKNLIQPSSPSPKLIRPSPSPSPKWIQSSPSLSPSPKSTWSHKPNTQKDDELVQVVQTASSSLTKLTNIYIGKEGETRDHAMANMVLTELQAAKEPKKSQLRAKLMSVLIEHMTTND